jgi:hypothetical protein
VTTGMETTTAISPVRLWTGRILTFLPGAFLLFDGVMKLVKPAPVVQGTIKLGYPESCIFGLGIVLTLSVLLYLWPKTSLIGAVLLTGYLGGAVATHVRVSAGWFNILFPAIMGLMLWAGLTLRSPRLEAVVKSGL